MTTSEEHQRQAARIMLAALAPVGFALAGSGAIREHGLIDRPTHDIDLFTPAVAASTFSDAVDAAITTLAEHSYTPELHRASDQFARLMVTTSDGYLFEVDLGVDWRAHDPVWMEIGPVLAIEDAVANKVCALYGRAEPRDYLDVDAIRQTGMFTDTELLAIAAQHDPGFDQDLFAAQLQAVARLTTDDVSEYGVNLDLLAAVKQRLLAWQSDLTTPSLEHHRHEATYPRPNHRPGPGL